MTDKRINYSLSEVFGELRNVVLEENGEDKIVRKITNEEVIEDIGKKRTLLEIPRLEKSI